jgi:hypothetical protein
LINMSIGGYGGMISLIMGLSPIWISYALSKKIKDTLSYSHSLSTIRVHVLGNFFKDIKMRSIFVGSYFCLPASGPLKQHRSNMCMSFVAFVNRNHVSGRTLNIAIVSWHHYMLVCMFRELCALNVRQNDC